jgi:hypothetical protein
VKVSNEFLLLYCIHSPLITTRPPLDEYELPLLRGINTCELVICCLNVDDIPKDILSIVVVVKAVWVEIIFLVIPSKLFLFIIFTNSGFTGGNTVGIDVINI